MDKEYVEMTKKRIDYIAETIFNKTKDMQYWSGLFDEYLVAHDIDLSNDKRTLE